MEVSTSALPIIWRSSSETSIYEEARIGRIFNHRQPKRYPLAIVNATEESHIVNAVRLAAEKNCRVSVRSGGHSWAAWSVRDEAVLIDFGDYHEMTLDEETGIVRASPSTKSADLNAYLRTKGRMFAAGHCPDVAIGGFLLQGGVGWNARGWGWACEQVVAIDAVVAGGRVVRADSEQNSDLYWAARGCGPGFPGIVTRFHLQTRPAPKVMRSSAYIYPVSKYKVVFDWILKISPGFDEDTEIVTICTYPPGLDEPCNIVLFVVFKDTEDAASKALQPAQDSFPLDPLVHWFCQETSLEKEYSNQANINPSGHRYCCENAFINNDVDIPAVLEKALTTPPSKETYTFWYAMHPWSTRQLPDMALSLRTDHYLCIYTIWKDEKDDENCQAWVRDVMKDVERHSRGAYLGDSDFQVRRTKFWGDEEGKRLMEIRRKWDSSGLFCGYLDSGDQSGSAGLENVHEWAGG